ncbi:YncE family protein, partial [Candidatus Sumerlaeota bacterium]|nr:YncE family protein [Candidatus Sumerlaeota bacterium]
MRQRNPERYRYYFGILLASFVFCPAAWREVCANSNIPAGTAPNAIAINPVTNKIYVANFSSNNVTVIDGTTHATTTVGTGGSGPIAIAVNPVTNKIYVCNYLSDNVTRILGSNDTAAIINNVNFNGPIAVAISPATGRVHIVNYFGSSVTIYLSGNDQYFNDVPVGSGPSAIAIDPNSSWGKLCVTNSGSGTFTEIDAAGSTQTFACGSNPQAVCCNPIARKFYFANYGGNNVKTYDSDQG